MDLVPFGNKLILLRIVRKGSVMQRIEASSVLHSQVDIFGAD